MKCLAVGAVLMVLFHLGLGRYIPVLVNVPPTGYHNKLTRQGIVGGWIQDSQFFPIQVNVPDIFSAIGSGLSTTFMNFSDSFGSWLQSTPFFNQVTNQFTPKPMKQFVVLVPAKDEGLRNHFEGLENSLEPVYP